MQTMPVLTPRDRRRLEQAHALLGAFLNGKPDAAPRQRRRQPKAGGAPRRSRLGRTLNAVPETSS